MTDLFSYKPNGSTTAVPLQIKLGSRNGWYEDTADIQTVNNSEYVGEIVSQITYSKRAISFQSPVHADTADNLQTAVRAICTMFRPQKQPGKLYYKNERYINVYPSGTPKVTDVSETFAWVTVSLTAANPFWYDATTPTVYSSGQTITNSGDFDAEVTFTASNSATITFASGDGTFATIRSRGSSSYPLTGLIFTITDNEITVKNSSGSNRLYYCDINSDYPLIPVGQSSITGANNITIKQRWFGV